MTRLLTAFSGAGNRLLPDLEVHFNSMDRRHFFRSEPIGGLLLPDLPVAAVLGDLSLIRVSRRAMATTFEIALPFGTPNALEVAEDALDLIDEHGDSTPISWLHRSQRYGILIQIRIWG